MSKINDWFVTVDPKPEAFGGKYRITYKQARLVNFDCMEKVREFLAQFGLSISQQNYVIGQMSEYGTGGWV